MNAKKILKKLWRVTAGLHKSVSSMDEKTAESILRDFSPDPATTCVASNTIDPQYDLQIIVPAYNVEKYIAQCLESVCNQKTGFSYLVTVINDGSTDRTLDIIRDYQARFADRMEVIDQKNKGLSGARNTGLRSLKGKYIAFLDSDDVLTDNAVDSLLKGALTGNCAADIVQGSWYSGIEIGGVHNVHEERQLSGFPWGKIYKAELLEHFRFPEGYWFEDTAISFILYGKKFASKVIPDVVYGYRLNPEGITSKSKGAKRSVESYYVTALCLRELPDFHVPYDSRAYELFLSQCLMNWRRCAELPQEVREAIFVLEAGLWEKYFKEMHSETNKGIEMAFRKKQFHRFEILARTS